MITVKFLEFFKNKRKEAPFLIFISFLISFIIARSWVYLEIGDPLPGSELYIIHHLYLGIAFLIIAGWLAINYKGQTLKSVTAIIYGAGLGIFFDVIGLLLTHFGDYYDGITYTVVVIVSLVLLNIVYFQDFWKTVGGNIRTYAEKRDLRYGPLNLMGLVSILGEVDKRMPETGRVTALLTGLILVGGGILILMWPDLIRYWVALAFFLSGITYIIRVIRE